MLQFFSASTNIVNSKRAITECLENALQGEPDLNCDLIIIYTAMGHNFKVLLSEARNLSPGARIVGCTCAGIIGKNGSDESMTALAIMVVKGPKKEILLTNRKTSSGIDPYKIAAEMAQELKKKNTEISCLLFLPSVFEWLPLDRAVSGIKSVFGLKIPIFGGAAIDNFKIVNCFHFFNDDVVERGAVMVGFADPTLKFISRANHGFGILEEKPFIVTKSRGNCIYEFNGRPVWKVFTETLGIPENTGYIEVILIAFFAGELPENLHKEYGSRYILFGPQRDKDNNIIVPITVHDGMKIWLTKRDEKKMFEGVDWMISKVLDELKDNKPLAVFHADCALRGKFSLQRILKDELINHIQYPICKGENIPWIGLYSGGEFARIGEQTWFHQVTSSLFVIYR